MKLSIVTSFLLLGAAPTAAAEVVPVFGRSMRKRAPPAETIHQRGNDAAKQASDPNRWAAKTSKQSNKSSALSINPSSGDTVASKQPAAVADQPSDVSARSKGSKDALANSTVGPYRLVKSKQSKVVTASIASSKQPKVSTPKPVQTVTSKQSKVTADESVDTVLSKRSRRSKASKKFRFEESMSYGFSMSMSLPSVFGTTTTIRPPPDLASSGDTVVVTTIAPPEQTTEPTQVAPSSSVDTHSSSDEPHISEPWGRIVFQYLSQCAGLELNLDSCLASRTIDAFMNMEDMECGVSSRVRSLHETNRNLRVAKSSSGGVRFLQESSEADDECCQPEVTEAVLRPIMETTRQECEEDGVSDSDEEFNG